MTLSTLIDQLESFIPFHEQTNTQVSSTTVGWQIAHALKVVKGVIKSMELSQPEDYKSKFSLSKTVIMGMQKIPRGKGRSPKIVLPKEEEQQLEALKEQIIVAKQALATLASLPKDAHFVHPLFGGFKKKQAEKFIKIHTQHHVAIIEDMLQA